MKVLIFMVIFTCVNSEKLAVYWGQDSAGGLHYTLEKSIDYFCNNFEYDVIPIAFLDYFFYPFNKDSFPSINFANHCNTTFENYPGLLNCPKVASAIATCQEKGKSITLSLGGAAGLYGFSSSTQAVTFANTIWNLFLGGSSTVRPFGEVVLNGIDLDIEAGSTVYYVDFIKTIRSLMNVDDTKKYLITGAPQCPYPDVVMGPGAKGTVLHDIAQEFDYLFVQFYNNYCYLGSPQSFNSSITDWFQFAAETRLNYGKGPLIFIGLPSHPRASSGAYYYQTPDQVKAVYEKLSPNENLGGIMLWDASFDMNNYIGGRPYSSYIAEFVKHQKAKPTESTGCFETVFGYFYEGFSARCFFVFFGCCFLVLIFWLFVRFSKIKKQEKSLYFHDNINSFEKSGKENNDLKLFF